MRDKEKKNKRRQNYTEHTEIQLHLGCVFINPTLKGPT